MLRSFAAAALIVALTATSASPKKLKDQPLPVKPPATVDVQKALYLIRTTLLTLNDANRSGNYSVLRDLAAPSFQARNSAADLAASFADLRGRKFDLFGAAISAPQLTVVPVIDGAGRLRLTGYFPTRPLRIDFDLHYEVVDGHWRPVGIAIATPQAAPAVNTNNPASIETNAPQLHRTVSDDSRPAAYPVTKTAQGRSSVSAGR